MSSLAAALAAQKPLRTGGRCTVDIRLETLDDIDKQALANALKPGSGLTSTEIARALEVERKPGQPEVKGQTIARHRRKECTCERGATA